jgi:uncharacterized protein (UPF0332 family)
VKPEQAALLRKARQSLRGARVLAYQELLYDFAVSRAYYVMFYAAEAFLLEDGLAFSKHSAVIAAFGERFAKTGRVPAEFHRYLLDGEDRRNSGDYGLGPGLSRADADEQIARAERFIDLVERLLSPNPPDEGTESETSVRDHE